MNVALRDSIVPGTRRGMMRRSVLGALIAVIPMMSHPGGKARAGAGGGGSPVIDGDTYVGRTSDPEVAVAIVLGVQHATAYVCDGVRHVVDLWFQGPIIENAMDLATTDGDRFVGCHTASDIAGWVTTRDGRVLSYGTQRATGTAGLYIVSVDTGGSIHGESSTGGVLKGEQLHARPAWAFSLSADAPADWQRLGLPSLHAFEDGVTFTAQITLPDAHIVPVGVWVPSGEPGRFWVILLANGEARSRGLVMQVGA